MTKEPRSRAGHEKRSGRAGRDLPPADDTPIIHGVIPPRDVLLRFISEHPEQASKREIAKAFGLDGTVLGSWLHALSYVMSVIWLRTTSGCGIAPTPSNRLPPGTRPLTCRTPAFMPRP